MIASAQTGLPAGDSLFFYMGDGADPEEPLLLSATAASLWYDHQIRMRLGGTNLSDFIMAETAVPTPAKALPALLLAAGLSLRSARDADAWLLIPQTGSEWRATWAACPGRRLASRVALDALMAVAFGLTLDDATDVLADCWRSSVELRRDVAHLRPIGFWRVDKDKDPELRHTVLTLIAFHDLEERIRACDGDRDAGIEAFLGQNQGEGWMLPETLRLADYGLSHDGRAQHAQPVASRLGPRLFDWQLAQGVDESWRECHLHARNLLGAEGYRDLQGRAAAQGGVPERRIDVPAHDAMTDPQDRLFP